MATGKMDTPRSPREMPPYVVLTVVLEFGERLPRLVDRTNWIPVPSAHAGLFVTGAITSSLRLWRATSGPLVGSTNGRPAQVRPGSTAATPDVNCSTGICVTMAIHGQLGNTRHSIHRHDRTCGHAQWMRITARNR